VNDSTSRDPLGGRDAQGREVSPRTLGPMGALVMALAEAEDGLVELPLTGEAQPLRWKLGALKTVTNGLVRGIPKLTEVQRKRLVVDALALASDVNAMRERLAIERARRWA
jgi:hypothetical protein